jgi:hypothetical protein
MIANVGSKSDEVETVHSDGDARPKRAHADEWILHGSIGKLAERQTHDLFGRRAVEAHVHDPKVSAASLFANRSNAAVAARLRAEARTVESGPNSSEVTLQIGRPMPAAPMNSVCQPAPDG